MDIPEFLTVKAACAIVGGDKPINQATYYRAVKRGELPAPERVTMGVARVRRSKLIDALNRAGA